MKSQFPSKAKSFLKKNGYYILLGVCVITIGVMITLALTSSETDYVKPKPTPTPIVTPSPSPSPAPATPKPTAGPAASLPTNLLVPVSGGTVGTDYVMDSFVLSSTLNQWQTHSGIDYVTAEPANVLATFDGEVVSVITNDILDGGTVVIEHEGGLKSVYKSLGADIIVKVGDMVKKGDEIGKTSTSAYAEFKEGTHLHFELMKDGEYLNPNDFFSK